MFMFRCILACLALSLGAADVHPASSSRDPALDALNVFAVGQRFLVSTGYKSKSLCLQRTDFHILDTPWSLRWAHCDIDDETQKWSSSDGVLSGVGATSRKRHVATDPPMGQEYLDYVAHSPFSIFWYSQQEKASLDESLNQGLTSLDFWYDSKSKTRKERSPVRFSLVGRYLRTERQPELTGERSAEFCLSMPGQIHESAVFSGFDHFNSVPALLSRSDKQSTACSPIHVVQVQDDSQESSLATKSPNSIMDETNIEARTLTKLDEEDALVQAAISIMHEGSTRIATM